MNLKTVQGKLRVMMTGLDRVLHHSGRRPPRTQREHRVEYGTDRAYFYIFIYLPIGFEPRLFFGLLFDYDDGAYMRVCRVCMCVEQMGGVSGEMRRERERGASESEVRVALPAHLDIKIIDVDRTEAT